MQTTANKMKMTIYVSEETRVDFDWLMEQLPKEGINVRDHTGVPRVAVLISQIAKEARRMRETAEKGGKDV